MLSARRHRSVRCSGSTRIGEEGNVRDGAKHAFQQDKELRKIIMRDDLRVRKAEHQQRMIKYKKERAKYDEWLEEQRTYQEARALLNLPSQRRQGRRRWRR